MASSVGRGGTCVVDIQSALDAVVEVVVALHGDLTPRSSLSKACRRWYSAAVCRPNAFRIPVQAWCTRACAELDAQLLRLHSPPMHELAEDLQIGLDHADEELRITDLSASFPSGVTVMLLNFTQQLGNLLTWLQLEAAAQRASAAVKACGQRLRELQEQGDRLLHECTGDDELRALQFQLDEAARELDSIRENTASEAAGLREAEEHCQEAQSRLSQAESAVANARMQPGNREAVADKERHRQRESRAEARRVLFRLEALEFRRRVALLSAAAQELQCRLPDPELPRQWAAWLDKAGKTAGLPEGHCMRYRQQREQTAAVWENNRRAFMSTVDHVNALMASIDRHESPGEDLNGAVTSRPVCEGCTEF